MNYTENQFVASLTVNELISILKETIREEVSQLIPPHPDKLNTPKEAAIRLRCSPPTLISYRNKGLIKETRIGVRKVLYKDSDIEAALHTIKKYKQLKIA